jgi:uncharacterized membrane protein YgaE (UPF0421/DUF939 family)
MEWLNMGNFLEISFGTLNLLSFVLGAIYGLSTSAFNRYKQWQVVVAYFVCVALWYAFKAGALNKIMGV